MKAASTFEPAPQCLKIVGTDLAPHSHFVTSVITSSSKLFTVNMQTSTEETTISRSSSRVKVERWTDVLESVVTAVEARQDERAAQLEAAAGGRPKFETTHSGQPTRRQPVNDTLGGPLTSTDISKLSMLCAEIAGNNSSGFNQLDQELLLQVSTMLEVHVSSASSVDLIREVHRLMSKSDDGGVKRNVKSKSAMVEEWLKEHRIFKRRLRSVRVLRYLILRNGLESANILLAIMSTPDMDRRLVSEDCIESCILLLRYHLTKNVTPMLTNTGHLPMLEHSKHSTSNETTTPTPKKRRRSSGAAVNQGILKELKEVYKLITASIPLLIQLFEAMEKLIYAVQMDDQPLLTLSSAAMSVFGIDPYQGNDQCHLLHITSIGLVTAISRRHPKHRTILTEDLFPVLLQLPSSKKSQRTFPVPSPPPFSPRFKRSSGGESDPQPCIQAMSVLIVSLIQSCVTFPSCTEQGDDVEGSTLTVQGSNTRLAAAKLNSGLVECQGFCDQLVAQILQRCSRKGEDGGASEFRPILSNLVDDCLVMQLLPEHPAAEMLLLTLSRGLANDIFKASSSAKTSSTSRNPASTLESTYLATAFDILGKISASVAGILASQRERPLSMLARYKKIKSKSEGHNVNSCFCGRYTFVDSLMVCCDTCRGFSMANAWGESRHTPRRWSTKAVAVR
ncbi:HEAT repeat associated with sister chromatid cohesion [Fragilaria crotonensis]|nr:HEAT repeat associated with sister chromatid cohesion [Fragilaria crotonensis]